MIPVIAFISDLGLRALLLLLMISRVQLVLVENLCDVHVLPWCLKLYLYLRNGIRCRHFKASRVRFCHRARCHVAGHGMNVFGEVGSWGHIRDWHGAKRKAIPPLHKSCNSKKHHPSLENES